MHLSQSSPTIAPSPSPPATSSVGDPNTPTSVPSKTFSVSYPPDSPLGITLSASPLSPLLSVTRVAPYSFSSNSGVLQGDLVLSCNGKEVTNLQLLMTEVNSCKGSGNGVMIKFER